MPRINTHEPQGLSEDSSSDHELSGREGTSDSDSLSSSSAHTVSTASAMGERSGSDGLSSDEEKEYAVENVNVPGYLLEFLRTDPEARKFIKDCLQQGVAGHFGRVFNNLLTVDQLDLEEFGSEYLHNIKNGNFYQYSLGKIRTNLLPLINCDKKSKEYGMLSEQTLAILTEVAGLDGIEEIKEKLYGMPIDKGKVEIITSQLIGAYIQALGARLEDAFVKAQLDEGCPYKGLAYYACTVRGISAWLDEDGCEKKALISMRSLGKLENCSFLQVVNDLNPPFQITPWNLEPEERLGFFLSYLGKIQGELKKEGMHKDSFEKVQTVINQVYADSIDLLDDNTKGVLPEYFKEQQEKILSCTKEIISELGRSPDTGKKSPSAMVRALKAGMWVKSSSPERKETAEKLMAFNKFVEAMPTVIKGPQQEKSEEAQVAEASIRRSGM